MILAEGQNSVIPVDVEGFNKAKAEGELALQEVQFFASEFSGDIKSKIATLYGSLTTLQKLGVYATVVNTIVSLAPKIPFVGMPAVLAEVSTSFAILSEGIASGGIKGLRRSWPIRGHTVPRVQKFSDR